MRGESLQVITKIADYELEPGQSYKRLWHVEGMSHEEIAATVIYFIHCDDDIKGGDMLFKRAFHKDEAELISLVFRQKGICPPQYQIIRDCMLPLGTAKALPQRLLVYSNSHVRKVTTLENCHVPSESVDTNETGSVQKRRMIVFYLINPEKRIVSTREVPPQPKEFGGSMSREDAMQHRLNLIIEREDTIQDWNGCGIDIPEPY